MENLSVSNMLIDDYQNSSSIQNVSYLIPIGICIYVIVASFRRILIAGLFELGVQYDMNPYLCYWSTHLSSTLLIAVVSYFFVRRIWRRILSGKFNCSRLFVSLLIFTVVTISITEFGNYLIWKIHDLRYENGPVYDAGYFEFLSKISGYVWVVEFVVLIITITLAVRSPRKAISSE